MLGLSYAADVVQIECQNQGDGPAHVQLGGDGSQAVCSWSNEKQRWNSMAVTPAENDWKIIHVPCAPCPRHSLVCFVWAVGPRVVMRGVNGTAWHAADVLNSLGAWCVGA
jgi:hypothetical protein